MVGLGDYRRRSRRERMAAGTGSGLVERCPENPILTSRDVPYPVSTVHNAAAVKLPDRYLLLFRSHTRSGRSIIGAANSADGVHFRVEPDPFLTPAVEGPFASYEEWGVEDPRINLVEDRYLLTYSAYSRHGVRIGLAELEDFRRVRRLALITPADVRNVVLFPERFGGRYARLDRPHTEQTPWSIWLSYSPDLVYWGDARRLIAPLPYHWDAAKVGPCMPPFLTDQGWLCLYHGVFPTMDGFVYRLGVALLDREDPSQVVGVADPWILEPEDPWERVGYVHNVVFSCGAVLEEDGILRLYWGGADTVLCTGTVSVAELVDLCLTRSRPPLP